MMKAYQRKLVAGGLALAMVVLVFATVPMCTRSEILNPGYVSGTISVEDETITGGTVWAFSSPAGFSARDDSITTGAYALTVEGDKDYVFYAQASKYETHTDWFSDAYIQLETKTAHVDINDHVTSFDFSVSPGFIDASVDVTGGTAFDVRWYVMNDKTPTSIISNSSFMRERGVGIDAKAVIPVMPWACHDENGDNDYVDTKDGDKFLCVLGDVYIGRTALLRYRLPTKYITVMEGETVYVNWDIVVTQGTVSGIVEAETDDLVRYDIYGNANVDGSPVQLHQTLSPGKEYGMVAPAGEYTLFPLLHFYDAAEGVDAWLHYGTVPETVTIGAGQDITHNWDLSFGYVTGTIDVWGAYPDYSGAQILANHNRDTKYSYGAYANTNTGDYKLVLFEDEWLIGTGSIYLYFDYDSSYMDDSYDTSYIRYLDYAKLYYGEPLCVEQGQTYDVDFSFGTAMVTLNYQIAGGGELWAPRIEASQIERYPDWKAKKCVYCYGYGSDDHTELGEATVTLTEGMHSLIAKARVGDGSETTFGSLSVDVDPGDVVEMDIGAPRIVITSPTGMSDTSEASVTVTGTATDDVGVSTISLNGASVAFSSTGNSEDANEVGFSATLSGLVYGKNAITIIASDASGMTTTIARTIYRNNEPPEADVGGLYEGTEGTPLTLDASTSSDPYNDALTYRWDFQNDGIWDTDWSSSPTVSHTWMNECSGYITVQVSDGYTSDTATAAVVVSNVAPTIDSFAVTPAEPIEVDCPITVTATFTDPSTDTIESTIDWGDASSTTVEGTAIEETHSYAGPGVYTVALTVSDGLEKAEVSYRYVVVYDPDGGFVTGGGWIDSPAGAYAADETLTGRANFGFVSKYKAGATEPTGNVEFQFKVGSLNFHSSDFDWLVVAGTKAMFKGTGTINGEGNYGFQISAIDGDSKGDADTFRIKIWDKDNGDAVVYDNQMDDADDADPTTELAGGQIVVHKGS